MIGRPDARTWGRLDDLVAGRAVRCPSPSRVLVAHRADEVVPVLAEVDRATRAGCWALGFVAYEAARGLDPGLAVHEVRDGTPLVWFGLCEEPVPVPPVEPAEDPAHAYRAGPWQPGWTPEGYRRDVERVRARIAAGDTYQCNLTTRLHSRVDGDLERLYADLALSQRTPYAAYLDTGRHVVASASPELFFEWRGDRLLTRPMKGTAARGATVQEDRARLRALLASPKERAENVIVVDLLRNDVSRVAEHGTVDVPALCVPERYETVWQLTSDVTATLRPGAGLVDVFRALFPCGSVTGAPKPRTMEILRDLEDGPRGIYCGAIGLVAPPGSSFRARFSVAIRTVVVDRWTSRGVYGTGGGITWGSVPAAEEAELHAKAAVLETPPEDFALLETMAFLPGTGVRNLERHLDRLAGSADYFGFPFDPAGARARVGEAVRDAAPARVRLLVRRSGAVTVELGPLPVPATLPVVLAIDDQPVDPRWRWLHHKTTRRRTYTERAARHPEADDVVLLNDRGHVTESTVANLAVRLAGVWLTPPLEAGCLPGVERGRLVEQGLLHEHELTPDDLRRAESLALVSSLRGWRAATLLEPSLAEHQPAVG
ncbi:MAG TPA: aminodeoxychorismate synthase component I [Actinomycetales bacterium]|nr:aminodeoxychorismate synthase component I [Actinomycetales bacterium]